MAQRQNTRVGFKGPLQVPEKHSIIRKLGLLNNSLMARNNHVEDENSRLLDISKRLRKLLEISGRHSKQQTEEFIKSNAAKDAKIAKLEADLRVQAQQHQEVVRELEDRSTSLSSRNKDLEDENSRLLAVNKTLKKHLRDKYYKEQSEATTSADNESALKAQLEQMRQLLEAERQKNKSLQEEASSQLLCGNRSSGGLPGQNQSGKTKKKKQFI